MRRRQAYGQQPSDRRRDQREECRRKIEMTPGAQSRHDTPLAADTASATRHHCHTLGEGDGVKGRSRRQPVRAAQPLRPLSSPSRMNMPCDRPNPLRRQSRP